MDASGASHPTIVDMATRSLSVTEDTPTAGVAPLTTAGAHYNQFVADVCAVDRPRGTEKPVAPKTMRGGVLIALAHRSWPGFFIVCNPAKKRIRDRSIQHGSPDYQTGGSNKSKDIRERPASVELFLHVRRPNIACEPVRIDPDT